MLCSIVLLCCSSAQLIRVLKSFPHWNDLCPPASQASLLILMLLTSMFKWCASCASRVRMIFDGLVCSECYVCIGLPWHTSASASSISNTHAHARTRTRPSLPCILLLSPQFCLFLSLPTGGVPIAAYAAGARGGRGGRGGGRTFVCTSCAAYRRPRGCVIY